MMITLIIDFYVMSHNQAVRIPQHEVSTPFATEPQTTKQAYVFEAWTKMRP